MHADDSAGVGGHSPLLLRKVALPGLVALNATLGVVSLLQLGVASWEDWIVLAVGVLCCMIAGLVASATWSELYWGSRVDTQFRAWKRVLDTIFTWLEELPVSTTAITSLQRSLEDTLSEIRARRRPDV
jgi:hypothetical protein